MNKNSLHNDRQKAQAIHQQTWKMNSSMKALTINYYKNTLLNSAESVLQEMK
jgi:hypothetical protein